LNERLNSDPNLSVDRKEEQIQLALELYRDFGITEVYLPKESPFAPSAFSATSSNSSENKIQLHQLQHEEIGNCIRCKLHRGRKTIVFGEGNPNAELMLIGEAPGAEEDIQGRPFVGRAGQLLMQMIKAIDYNREDVFIANILKCRPPGNRPPELDEIHQCSPFLWKQISIIRPKLILALGTFAAQTLLNSKSSISFLRSRIYDMPCGKVLATYHPSFLLRSPQKKPEAWEDLKLAKRTLQE
jgi:uracil-DNA glycosylase family 4